MGSIDKLLKYWNLSQRLRVCRHSLWQGRRSPAGEIWCLCKDPAYRGSSRHSQSLLALCGTCRTSYVQHLSSPKWSSASVWGRCEEERYPDQCLLPSPAFRAVWMQPVVLIQQCPLQGPSVRISLQTQLRAAWLLTWAGRLPLNTYLNCRFQWEHPTLLFPQAVPSS